MCSAEQTGWMEIADAVRSQLCRYVLTMPSMNVCDMKTFIEATQAAYWLEVNAAAFDTAVETEQAKTPFTP